MCLKSKKAQEYQNNSQTHENSVLSGDFSHKKIILFKFCCVRESKKQNKDIIA